MHKIRCKAYGKINLTLDVLGKREDGYHELVTLLQGINLYDTVGLSKAKTGLSLTCNIATLSTGAENLAYQAARLLQKKFPQIEGLKIHLQKRIPVAAGLAGGSTNAATVLWGVNQLYALGLSEVELRELAAVLGSDVPFCLSPLTAVGTGRGEKIKFYPAIPELWLVLLTPPLSVSTKEVYAHLAQGQIQSHPDYKQVLQNLYIAEFQQAYAYVGNVLEGVTFALYPQLAKWAEEIAELQMGKVMMSGSGPTLLVFMENEAKATHFVNSFIKPGWQILKVRTLNSKDLAGRMIIDE